MTTIRRDLIKAALMRAFTSIDYNIHIDFHKNYELRKQIILADNSLTEEEKTEAIRLNNRDYDRDKILYNSGTRRICENCNQKCLATLYCEYCVQNYLKANFSNWSSGNSEIDDLIRKCQSETLRPNVIIEWIPYDNLKNIKYLTRGGFSKIYTANWVGGQYEKWDSKEQQLIRFGTHHVILKELENVANASQRWFEEAESHLTISKKYPQVVRCFAPEVINGKEYTFKSDIYSIAMLMWEISFGLPPFINYNHDYNFVINIIDGMRPKIISEIPSKYKNLMEQCWNANPSERPNIDTLLERMEEIKTYYQNNTNELPQLLPKIDEICNNISSKVFTSKIHKFENLPEPKNATEEEQEAFHSKLYNLSIPDNNSNKKLSKVFKKLQINSKNDDIQNYNNRKTMQQQLNVNINDEDEVYNNPNLHSEEQDKLEIPDDGF
ncbi:kinase-like domain-containing protein [Rhizophagus clarus]|uniref:Kinase-like domain-containing protein n=1 Tax=Rhizophagus clarus TaxID=94130 RepID=A0A8H3L0B7_9GLOM|nr:kinase-like domain-containing protein [Rhizophagus clarus]